MTTVLGAHRNDSAVANWPNLDFSFCRRNGGRRIRSLLDSSLLTLLMSALTGALLPRFVSAERSPDQLGSVLAITTKWFLVFVLPLTVFLLMSTEQILKLWFGNEYGIIAHPAQLMLVTQFVVGLTSVFDLVLVSLNRNEYFALSRWVAVVATVLISLPLISRFQLSGLLYGLLGASLVSMATSLFLLHACGVITKLI